MNIRAISYSGTVLAILAAFELQAEAQIVDCSCLRTQPVLTATACEAPVPDLCRYFECFISSVQPPPYSCSQNPAPGTLVPPGTHAITVTVTDPGSGQSQQCVVPFVVNPPQTGPFALICAPDKSVECGTSWSFDLPMATNECCPASGTPGSVTITVLSTTTNGTCPEIIKRTWQAVDDCGNSAMCTQTVTVADTTPPTINCGQNETLNCGLAWDFTVPIISDNCTAPSDLALSILSTSTNYTCVPTFVATRIWKVTDACGNSTTCTQVVTIVDFTPPTITCANNKTIECGSSGRRFDPPTASDFCIDHMGNGSVTIAVVSTITNGTCPEVVTRTWSATDGCGNSSQCSQTVTVVDTTPPVLDCNCLQDPAVVQLTVTACSNAIPDLCLLAASCATDNCGPLTCTQSPPAGTIVFPGTHPITVTVTDCASNSVSCAVIFTVNPPPSGCDTNPCVPSPPGMVAWWPLDETTGSTVFADISGNGNTAIVESGGPVGSAGSPSAVPGKVAGANDFNGPGQRGRAPSSASLNFGTGSFSIDCWVKPAQPGGPADWHCMVDKYNRPAKVGYTFAIQTGKLVLLLGDGTQQTFVSFNSLGFGVWTFVGVSVDRVANTVTFHFNGFSEPPQSLAPAGSFNNTLDLLIGSYYPSPNPQGLLVIDELELFNRALATNEFHSIWNADSFGKCKTNCVDQIRVWNTGTGAAGSPDPHYTLVSAPPGSCTGPAQVINPSTIPSVWMPNGPNSQWIGAGSSAYCQEGIYHYRLCFYLACTDGASIVGQWTADDWGEIVLNGQPTGHTVPSTQFPNNGYDMWHPVSITNGFVCGTNCLDFYVTNANIGMNPTGFRAELTNVFNECCCTTQTVVSVFSGANANGLLPQNSLDNQFTLTCAPPGVSATVPMVIQPHPLWYPNGPNSQWIGPDPSHNSPGGVYCYTLNFDLPPCDGVPSYVVTGQWMGDDTGTIYLNGQPTGFTLPNGWAFTNWHPFSITSGLVPGPNTLTFYVTNASQGSTGIRVELTATASCCDCTNCTVWISCPPDIDRHICGTQGHVVYPAPTASSSCGSITNIVCTPPSSSVFPLGTNIVTCTAYDSLGNSASCSFLVILRPDITPPDCPPLNLTVTGCPPRVPDFSTNGLATDNCTPSSQLIITQSIPPGTPLTPGSTTVVILQVCDQAGNCRVCDVIISAASTNPPPKINCPQDITVLTCSNSGVVFYTVKASGGTSPAINCTPPSSSTFPLGTNVVTCTVTDACGYSISCSFKVIVKYGLAVNPTVTFLAGLPDNFAGSIEPSPTNACMVNAFSGFPFWKGFDAMAHDTLLGHRFSGLPNNIVQAQFIIRMKPNPSNSGSDNDGLFMGLGASCTFGSFFYSASIKAIPGAVPPTGGTWIQPSNGPTTFTINLSAAFVNKLNTDQFLDVVVHDDTIVDYMRLRLWTCPPKHPGIGIPFTPIGDTTFAVRPATDEPDDLGPAITLFPDASGQSGVLLEPGTPGAITFTTQLSFDAPDGSTFALALPGEAGTPGFTPLLTLGKGTDGQWQFNLKLDSDLFTPGGSYRVTAVDTNCDFASFTHSSAEPDLENLVRFNSQPGVTSIWLTITLEAETGQITFDIPDCIWTPDNARKGWDGCIYGDGRPSKGLKTNHAARLVITPEPRPRQRLYSVPFALLVRGFPDITIYNPDVTAMGRKWGDGHVTLMKAYDDGEEARKIEFTTFGEGGGVHVGLGRTDSFDIGIHHFENGDIPSEEQLFRIIGPPVLINRPAPPTNYLRLARPPDGAGVHCTVDFTDLGTTAIVVELWNDGVLVGAGRGEGSTIPPESPLVLDRWPERLGRPAINEGLFLTSSEKFNVSGLMGDEIRIIPELPPGTDRMPYVSRLECVTSEGMESVLYELQTTPAGGPVRLNISRSGDLITLDWTGDGYSLQGAESLEGGPWVDLCEPSPASPDGKYQVTLPAQRPRSMYRLKQVTH